ncbi:MAG TPA: ATP-binding protein [Casimicrobiaceae bacterium]|nr:ATP-binding protein [Casimicrobiaceae bacterium]
MGGDANAQTKIVPADDAVSRMDLNAEALAREIRWFAQIANDRLRDYFPKPVIESPEDKDPRWYERIMSKGRRGDTPGGASSVPLALGYSGATQPDLAGDRSVYAEFVNYYNLERDERLVLMLAIIPHVQPHLLDVFLSVNKALGRGFTEFGGVRGSRHGGFIPTIETALFLLAGNDLAQRFRLYRLFEPDHVFSAHQILVFDQEGRGNEPYFSSPIQLSDEYVDFFTKGTVRKPQFSIEFPAKRLTTTMEWSDLVVDDFTAAQIDELRIWLKHGRTLHEQWDMGGKLKPGYKVLFHGPPGTGKTMTAVLLGKMSGLDVYRVDLAMVVSKYIGETVKNLEKVFRKAENWILFFDEADALFGKRTTISDSHDKYANQEIAYLLQRLEDYGGLVILASNMRSNVDEAFTRRLQSIIQFQKPQARERFRIWVNAFSKQCTPPGSDDLMRLAQQHELSGGSIMNVVQYASLQALNRGETTIAVDDLVQGIRKELRKEGKTL